ncbi:MAG: hypothetical protein V4660_09670 [Pseudomonadota bacterium]
MDLKVNCEGCGADLAFVPGTKSLTCRHCQHQMEFAEPESQHHAGEELDLATYLNNFSDNNPQIERLVIRCKGCGAETELQTNHQSCSCPFCDTALVVQQAHLKNFIKPKGILPFAIKKESAREQFTVWLNKLWFAPGDLKKQFTQHDKFIGLYLPFWTYDCDTSTYYVGQRGVHYQETVSETNSSGQAVTKTVTRTRWSPAQGRVECNFDDILVPATKSLPTAKLNALEPWGLPDLVDYKDEYLTGYVAETYQVELKSGYETAKIIMENRIRGAVEQDIGGDTQTILSLDIQHSRATFKHILLPVWVSAYRYRNKLYQIIVNARTGDVQGERPWSWVKITLASLLGASLVAVAMYFVAMANQTNM